MAMIETSGADFQILIAWGFGAVVCGAVASAIANSRGLQEGFFLRGLLLGVFGILWAAVAKAPPTPGENVRQGDIVRLLQPIDLNGASMPVGWVSKVHDLQAHDGIAWVLLDSPTGDQQWAPKNTVAQA